MYSVDGGNYKNLYSQALDAVWAEIFLQNLTNCKFVKQIGQ